MEMQTNRTMLLEEVNPQKWDIITLIGDLEGRKGLDDEHLKEIHSCLEVHCFKEFLDKMEPTIYLYMNIDVNKENDSVSKNRNSIVDIQCSIQKQANYKSYNCRAIKLNMDYPFLRMILERKEAKRTGKFIFNKWESIVSDIYPIEEAENLYRLREEARLSFIDYYKTGAKKEDSIKKNIDVINQFYINKTAIPMFIRFVQEEFQKDSEIENSDENIIKMDDTDSQVKILFSSYDDRSDVVMSNQCKKSYKEFLDNIYFELDSVNKTQKKIGCMFLYGDWSDKVEEKEEEIILYNKCLEIYKKLLQVYWNEMKSNLEVILGVYSFFEQYDVKNPKMRPSLIVTNCKNEKLCTLSNKIRFSTYLKTVNEKNYYEHTIWYAILPRILFPEMDRHSISRLRFLSKEYVEREKEKSVEINPVEKKENIQTEIIYKDNEKEKQTRIVSTERKKEIQKEIVLRERNTRGRNELDVVLQLIPILTEVQIQIFISADATENNNFEGFSKEGLSLWQKSLDIFKKTDYTDYIVPTYPNFTVIPREQSNFSLGKKARITEKGIVEWSKDKLDDMRIWIEGLYIEASYVGTGILAACQCQNYLMEHLGDAVYEDYPGVNYRIAKAKNRKKTHTTMAREIFDYPNELKNEIKERAAGLIFAPNKYVMVVMDSTLSFTKDGRVPISTIQTITYMERIIRYQTNDFKRDLIKKFFANTSDSTRMQWQNRIYKENSILKEENSINYSIDEKNEICKLQIKCADTYREKEFNISNQV